MDVNIKISRVSVCLETGEMSITESKILHVALSYFVCLRGEDYYLFGCLRLVYKGVACLNYRSA